MAECDEMWPLCEKDIRCKIPEERKAETEELNPQSHYKSRPLNPHRCWIETLTRNSFRHDDFWECECFVGKFFYRHYTFLVCMISTLRNPRRLEVY